MPQQPDSDHLDDRGDDALRGESRWPMASAVVAAMVLTVVLPDDLRLGPRWLLPALEAVLLIAIVSADPGTNNHRSAMLRRLSIGLVSVLVAGATWSTFRLIDDLISGGSATSSAAALLQAGASVWLSSVLAFSLLYFELDGGGAARRLHEKPQAPDLAFPQQLNPGLATPSWRPRFFDYLYLSLTNSTAFSPTDVMPLAPWAKLAMAIQALISLAILGLVIARAVNVLT